MDTCDVNEKLDIRSAIRDATTAFRRFPILLSLPVVSIGLASWGLNPIIHPVSSKNPSLFVSIAVFAVVCLVLTSIAEVLTAAMPLRAREGVEPSLKQTGEVRALSRPLLAHNKALPAVSGMGSSLGIDLLCGYVRHHHRVVYWPHRPPIVEWYRCGCGWPGRDRYQPSEWQSSLVIWSRYMFDTYRCLLSHAARARVF